MIHKIRFIYLQTNKEPWFNEAIQLYQKKINHFKPIEIQSLKSDSSSRKDWKSKILNEEKLILKYLGEDQLIITFDEKGKAFKDSIDFSSWLMDIIQFKSGNLNFIIGGAYGVSNNIKKKSHQLIQMSHLTMNHQVASVVALEQIYRGFTIHNKIPYHNI